MRASSVLAECEPEGHNEPRWPIRPRLRARPSGPFYPHQTEAALLYIRRYAPMPGRAAFRMYDPAEVSLGEALATPCIGEA